MKIAVNRNYGGFRLNKEQENMLRPFVNDDFIDEVDYNHSLRTNAKLIEVLEQIPSKSIRIIEIPDNATDWVINEYDGCETIYYVVDGKIKRA
jgi:hypothetical protein